MIAEAKPDCRIEAAADTLYFRLTGMVKARVMRLDEDMGVLVETGEEQDVYFEDVANMRGMAMEGDGVYLVTAQECKPS